MKQKLSRNFHRSEFACKCGCGYANISQDLVNILQRIRNHLSVPITVTSGCRCDDHNRKVGGGERSQHLFCRAADVVAVGVPPDVVGTLAKEYGATGVGFYETFTHIDVRPGRKATWAGKG